MFKNKLLKICLVCLIPLVMVGMLSGCMEDINAKSAEQQMANDQAQLVKAGNDKYGAPEITQFTEKGLVKYLYELRDRSDLICYCYTKNEFTGKYVYEGKCMGYGIPYSTQFSNPETYTKFNPAWGGGPHYDMAPQAEPNGLYMPTSAEATWVMLINEETGKMEPQYFEPKVNITGTKKPRRLCEEFSLPKDY